MNLLPLTAISRARSPRFGLVLLFIASRLVYLLLLHPYHFSSFTDEELYVGIIAKELVSGLHMPFIEYRTDDFSGGSLVVGALASGFFRLFGPTVFALKLTPLLLFTLALVCWYVTIERQLGTPVAVYFGMLFCLSPPLFTAASLTAIGYHTESIFFTALSLLLFFRLLTDETRPALYAALLGVTAGFGLWFAYIYAITLLALLAFCLWRAPRMLASRRFAWFLLGFLAGFSPWVYINVQSDFSGLMIRGTPVWEYFGIEHLRDAFFDYRSWFPFQLVATLASDTPLDLQRRVINLAYALLYLLPMAAYGCVVIRTSRSASKPQGQPRSGIETFAGLYVCLFAIIVQLSDFRGFRYNMALYPFAWFFVAYTVVRLQEQFPLVEARVRHLFFTCLILLGVVSHSLSFSFSLSTAGSAFSAKGYNFRMFVPLQVTRLAPLQPQEVMLSKLEASSYLPAIIQPLPPEDRHDLSVGLAQFLTEDAVLGPEPVEIVVARLQRLIPVGFEKYFYYRLGGELVNRQRGDLEGALKAIEFLKRESASLYRVAQVGVIDTWPRAKIGIEGAPSDLSLDSLLTPSGAVAPEFLPVYWRAVGYYSAHAWYGANDSLGNVKTRLTAVLKAFDPNLQRAFLQGIGRYLFFRLVSGAPQPAVAPIELERFPSEFHPGLFEGMGMGLSEFHLVSEEGWTRPKALLWSTTTAGLSEVNRAHVREGWNEFAAMLSLPHAEFPLE